MNFDLPNKKKFSTKKISSASNLINTKPTKSLFFKGKKIVDVAKIKLTGKWVSFKKDTPIYKKPYEPNLNPKEEEMNQSSPKSTKISNFSENKNFGEIHFQYEDHSSLTNSKDPEKVVKKLKKTKKTKKTENFEKTKKFTKKKDSTKKNKKGDQGGNGGGKTPKKTKEDTPDNNDNPLKKIPLIKPEKEITDTIIIFCKSTLNNSFVQSVAAGTISGTLSGMAVLKASLMESNKEKQKSKASEISKNAQFDVSLKLNNSEKSDKSGTDINEYGESGRSS